MKENSEKEPENPGEDEISEEVNELDDTRDEQIQYLQNECARLSRKVEFLKQEASSAATASIDRQSELREQIAQLQARVNYYQNQANAE